MLVPYTDCKLVSCYKSPYHCSTNHDTCVCVCVCVRRLSRQLRRHDGSLTLTDSWWRPKHHLWYMLAKRTRKLKTFCYGKLAASSTLLQPSLQCYFTAVIRYASVQRAVRSGLYATDDPSFSQLVEDMDDNLFTSIRHNPHHVLYKFLPDTIDHKYNLRPGLHSFH